MAAVAYMVIRNAVGDPLVMELTTGDVSWLVPHGASVSQIKYFTHVTQQGKVYYENLVSNVVQWELPGIGEISDDARFVFESLLQMQRQEVEQALSMAFDEQAINRQMADIDSHFYGQQTELKKDISPVVVENSPRRRSSVLDSPPPPSISTPYPSNSHPTAAAAVTPMQKMFANVDSSINCTASSTSSYGEPMVLAIPPPIPALPAKPLRTKTIQNDTASSPTPLKLSHVDNLPLNMDELELMERPSMSFNSRRVSARKPPLPPPPLPPPREEEVTASRLYPSISQQQSYPAASQRYSSAVEPTSQNNGVYSSSPPPLAGPPPSIIRHGEPSQSASKSSASMEIAHISPSSKPIVRKTALDIDKKFKVPSSSPCLYSSAVDLL